MRSTRALRVSHMWRDLRATAALLRGGRPPLDRDDPRLARLSRMITIAYCAMAIGLTPWLIYLATSLPERNFERHYDLAWTGFDVMLVAAMAATAWFAHRRNPRVQLAANAAATLLIVDAWIDVTTAASGSALTQAVVLALFAELPVAALSLAIARRSNDVLAHRAGIRAAG